MGERSAWHSSWWFGMGAFVLAGAVQIGSLVWPEKIKPHPYLFGAFCLVGFSFVAIGSGRALWLFLRAMRPAAVSSALEIIFEPLNPARRFWSLEGHIDDLGRRYPPYWEHRVEIRNNSQKTIRNVMVTVERTGQLPQLPFNPPFKRTQAEKCDLNPGCSELVRVNIWPHPKQQVGMPCGDSAWLYGPIKVIASGDDTPSVVKEFAFNYETDQMLFDVEAYRVQ